MLIDEGIAGNLPWERKNDDCIELEKISENKHCNIKHRQNQWDFTIHMAKASI